jgi:hypothetical protein
MQRKITYLEIDEMAIHSVPKSKQPMKRRIWGLAAKKRLIKKGKTMISVWRTRKTNIWREHENSLDFLGDYALLTNLSITQDRQEALRQGSAGVIETICLRPPNLREGLALVMTLAVPNLDGARDRACCWRRRQISFCSRWIQAHDAKSEGLQSKSVITHQFRMTVPTNSNAVGVAMTGEATQKGLRDPTEDGNKEKVLTHCFLSPPACQRSSVEVGRYGCQGFQEIGTLPMSKLLTLEGGSPTTPRIK